MAKVAVMGTGYVGLSTGACLSSLGHRVTCLDVDAAKISKLREGIIPIVEDGLEELVKEGVHGDVLHFTTEVGAALSDAEVVFLCLPTPQGDDGRADLSYVEGAIPDLRGALARGAVLVNKSTVPVGTARWLAESLGRPDVSIVSNPEFLRQGTAVHDFMHPTRVVIGSDDPAAASVVAGLYDRVEAPILVMNAESAEMVKYAANSFLATKLTFINAIADICEVVGADIFDVVDGLGRDPRIGGDFLKPGPGWGGSCFPKDTRALVHIARGEGYDFALLRGVIETNDQQYARIAGKVVELCGGSVKGKVIASWGLTFKAHTDDLRDSPAVAILTMLHEMGATVKVYEPTARGQYRSLPWANVVHDALEVCDGADALVVLTEWPEFATIDPKTVAERLGHLRVVDGRNVLDREAWLAEGFTYKGVGR